jgi:hypothetical protein
VRDRDFNAIEHTTLGRELLILIVRRIPIPLKFQKEPPTLSTKVGGVVDFFASFLHLWFSC